MFPIQITKDGFNSLLARLMVVFARPGRFCQSIRRTLTMSSNTGFEVWNDELIQVTVQHRRGITGFDIGA